MDPALKEWREIKLAYFVYSEEKGITSSRRRREMENFDKEETFSLDFER